VAKDAVEHFRQTVEVVDLVGSVDPGRILATVAACARRDPGPAAPLPSAPVMVPVRGHLPECTEGDPAGYFVIFPDPAEQGLVVEHYTNDGALDHVLDGRKPADLCATAIRLGLVTRLDHAAYLGQELARAEQALQAGRPFFQGAAPGEECPEELLPPSPKPT